MTTQIIIHLLPNEIDWFEWQAKQLQIGKAYLSLEDTVIIDATLNLNLVDWENSKIPKNYFIEKFKQVESLFDWCQTIFEIDDVGKCLGIDDKRRSSIRISNPDNFIYLDCDIIFKPETLAYLMSAAKTINNEYYIISPQTPKLWDYTWDVLVNEYYSKNDYGFEKVFNPYDVLVAEYGDVELIPINTFKFGGGWFNLISNSLLKKTDIPDSFGAYGIDDTYVMYCCDIMKSKAMDVNQYIIRNIVVAENYKYRINPYSSYLNVIDKKQEFKSKAESQFKNELNKFYEKIYSNNYD